MNLDTMYVVRHGIAEGFAASGRDADRRLTEEGIEKTRRAAQGMAAIGVAPDLILSSHLARAVETAEIIAATLNCTSLRQVDELAPGVDFEALVRQCLQAPKPQRVMVVGHQPDLGMLCSWLMTGDPEQAFLPFRKAATACLQLYGARETLRGSLQWFLAPAQLRKIAA